MYSVDFFIYPESMGLERGETLRILLAVISAAFIPTQASNGKALTTSTTFARMTAGSENLPLAPGGTGKP
jgi:hypothetical protein